MSYRLPAPLPAPTPVPVCGNCRFLTEEDRCNAPIYGTIPVQINLGRKIITVRGQTINTSPRPCSVLNKNGKCDSREAPEPTTWIGRIARRFLAA